MSEQRKSCSGQPSNSFTVEKMTATSTTSPKTDPSNDIEDREIQNALDKKRKKRIKHTNSKDSKHIKVEGAGSSIHQYFEASKELETTQRISQDLPNCNWLEQKIKLSENKKSSKSTQRINNLFGSDSEEDNLVVDDVFEENTQTHTTHGESSVPEVIKSIPSTSTIPKPDQKSLQVVHSTLPKYDDLESQPNDVKTGLKTDSESPGSEFVFSPPCITIAEEEGQQPIQIRVSIKGENNQFLFDNLQAEKEETKPKSNSQNQNQYNYKLGNLMKKIDHPNKEYARSVQDSDVKAKSVSKPDDTREREWIRKQEESNEKIKKLLALKEEIEKDIESLKNKKIQEMEQLIEIKTTKEKFMNELENLRMDVYKEKNLLDSFKHQNSVREKSLQQIAENQKPQYLGKPANEGVFPKSDMNPPSQQIHPPAPPSQSPQMSNIQNIHPPNERSQRYSHENVPTLAPTLPPSRPSIEQQHRDFLEYRQKLYERNAVVSPNSEHLPRDYNRSMSIPDFSRTATPEVYKQMLENAARMTRLPGERQRDLESNSSIPYMGFQPPGMLVKPGIARQYEQEILERTRQSLQQYPGLPPAISQQYSKGLPPLPPDTTLSHVAQRSGYPPHSAHLAINPSIRSSMSSSLLSPPRPNPENVPTIETSESKCEACGAAANFMCSACKGAHYCSTECQRGHWMVHNRACQQNLRR
eukprot:GFUD01000619.1.p1 GENE.GFUD01000619.1~~GFUD01000619.1.p1  ORF type:complete len:698 (-),score=140.71 GFUD01000619.1:188-2281(-)